MTTSGKSIFILNTNSICTMALQKVGAVQVGQNARIEDLVVARQELTAMAENWRADDIFLWKTKWLVIPLTISSYVIGTNGACWECIRNHTSELANEPITGGQYNGFWYSRYSAWTTALSYSVGDIIVGSDNLLYECTAAHVSAANTKPITGSDYATAWSLFTSITPVAWSAGVSYHSLCDITLDSSVLGANKGCIGIGNAFLRDAFGQDTYINSHLQAFEYFRMANKWNPGKPTMVYFKKEGADSNELFFYPYPNDSTVTLNVEVFMYPETFDAAVTSPDFLQEWYAPLADGLAVRLYSYYPGRGRVSLGELQNIAQGSYDKARGLDTEKGEAQFVPDMTPRLGRY